MSNESSDTPNNSTNKEGTSSCFEVFVIMKEEDNKREHKRYKEQENKILYEILKIIDQIPEIVTQTR